MANKTLKKGTDFTFTVMGISITAQKDFSYSVTKNMVDTTCSEDGDWTTQMPVGGKKISGSASFFFATNGSLNYNTFLQYYWNDASLAVSFKPVVTSDCSTLSGVVYLTDIKPTGFGSTKDVVSAEISFESTGPFTLS